jgi:hypothetical protein
LLQAVFLTMATVVGLLVGLAMVLSGRGPEVRTSGDVVGFEFSAMASGTWPILIGILSLFICQYCVGKWLAGARHTVSGPHSWVF